MLEDSEIVLLRAFMYAAFDWRMGVLAGEPQFRGATTCWETTGRS